MRALVTGAGGVLGGRLTQMLAGRGAKVTVLARVGADLRHLRNLKDVEMRVVRGGLTEFGALKEAVRGCTHVFHCASRRTDWVTKERYFETNVLGTGMLLEAASRERRLERFVHVSTTDVYGFPRQPGDEAGELVDTRLPYQRTKLQGEMAVWGYADEGLPVTVIRPATIYGPRSEDAVVEIVRRLRQHRMPMVDGGRARGGFCYVDNVACAMLSVSTREATLGEAYNLTDGTGVTWREYVKVLAEGLGLREPRIDLPFRVAMAAARSSELAHAAFGLPGRPLLTRQEVYLVGRDKEFTSPKATRDFGYVPGIGFAEGMRRTVGWVRSVDQPPCADAESQFLRVQ